MDLSKLIPLKNEPKAREYYWSLIIEPGWVSAGVWFIEDGRTKIMVFSPPVAWEEKEELINASDSVLSVAIQGIGAEELDISKTVFGVSSSWVQSGEIKEEQIGLIKEVCSKLSLSPVGFVVIPEAISHLIKNDEGSSPNMVTVGIYKDTLDISVFGSGKLIGNTQVSRSVNFDEDVIEGLSRFTGSEAIPHRFILHNSKEGELEEARQSLVKVNWEEYKDLGLMHAPKIEVFSSDKKVTAVSLAGSSEVSNVTGVDVLDPTLPVGENFTRPVVVDIPEPELPAEKLSEETIVETDKLKPIVSKEIPVITPEENKIAENSEKVTFKETLDNTTQAYLEVDEDKKHQKTNLGLSILQNITRSLLLPFEKKPFVFGLGILLSVLIISLLLWWYYPKATVTVFVAPQKVEEKLSLKVDTSNESLEQDGVISGSLKTASASGERTRETSGTKIVGDKAKGEVTLYRVGTSLTVKSGTVLVGPENLKFVMEGQANIASGSAGTPGTVKVSVASEGIGVQYNLSAGSKFVVGNYSTDDIEAKNDSPFTGGSSREISAVSKEDRDMLFSQLEDELKEKALGEIKSGVADDTILLGDTVETEVNSESYNSKVGDEAETLKLELDLGVKVPAISKGDLNKFLNSKLAGKIPDGYVMPESQLSYKFELKGEKDGVFDLDVYVSANVVTNIDKDKIAKIIQGRHVNVADEILEKEIPSYRGVQIKIKPSLTGKLKTLPHVFKNITVNVSSEN